MGTNQPQTSSADTPPGDSVSSSSIDEEVEKIRAWAKRYAERNGLVLNPDEKELATVLRGLARNRVRFGRRYCPCRLRTGDPKEDRKIICPCTYHQDEIEREGSCHCRLFFCADSGRKEEHNKETEVTKR